MKHIKTLKAFIMNILLLIGLTITGFVYGASSSITTEVDEQEGMLIQLFRRSETGIISRMIHLKDIDPFARAPYHALQERSNKHNLPWIVCDFDAAHHASLLESVPKQGFFDLHALLSKRAEKRREVDLTSFDKLSETISKEVGRKFRISKLSDLGIHIVDSKNKSIGFRANENQLIQQSYILAQLLYSLGGDLNALKSMITMYNQFKIPPKTRDKTYVVSWCKIYLDQHPEDEEIRTILTDYQNKD